MEIACRLTPLRKGFPWLKRYQNALVFWECRVAKRTQSFLKKGFWDRRLQIWSQNFKIQNGGSNIGDLVYSYTIFQLILDSCAVIDLKTLTRGFLELVVTILKFDFKN